MDTKGNQTPTTNLLASMPIAEDDVVYIAIKGSLHANDCSAFGLGEEEVRALTKKYPGSGVGVVNGVAIKTNVLDAINALGQLGYKVISSTEMDHKHDCSHTNCTAAPVNTSVCQTISEMDWERGIWFAAFNGDINRVKTLIEKSKNVQQAVNAPDNSGYSALHYAARYGHLDICKLLMLYGAHVDAQTKSGRATPLHKAAAAGKTTIVQFLLKSGACIDMQDADGQTVLHKAAGNRNCELYNVLVKTYPKLCQIKDSKGQTAANFLAK